MKQKTLIRQPWLHFLLLGALLFTARQWFEPPPGLRHLDSGATDSDLRFEEALARRWHLTDPVVIDRLVRNLRFLDSSLQDVEDHEVLADALDMNLHRNDLVVRRRLVQRMELVALSPDRIGSPTDDELRTLYQDASERFRYPATVRFDHLFFASDQDDPAARAESVANLPNAADFESVSRAGDTYIHGSSIGPIDQERLGRQFGFDFATELFGAQPIVGNPVGPLRSSHGLHLVWLYEVTPGSERPFEDVQRQLESEWRAQREESALQEQAAALRQHYGDSR